MAGGIVAAESAVGRTTYVQPGERYRVAFRAWGGTTTFDQAGNPTFSPEVRTNTQVGACWCDLPGSGAEVWPHNVCDLHCPTQADTRPYEPYTAWNPISAPECAGWPLPDELDPAVRASYARHDLCYNRSLGFTRDESTNRHELTWDWQKTRNLADLSQVIGRDYHRDVPAPRWRVTSVRVAWPMFGEPIMRTDVDPPYDHDAAFSNPRALRVRSLAETPHGRFPWGDIIAHGLVAQPIWVDPRPPVTRTGYALVADTSTGEMGLVALAQGAPVAEALKGIDFGGSVLSGMPIWARGCSGAWLQTAALRVTSQGSFPVADALVAGRSAAYIWPVAADTPLPGAYLVARLSATDPGVALSLREQGDAWAAAGEVDPSGDQVAGLLCQSGGACAAQVAPISASTAAAIPFQVDIQEAAPELESRSAPLGWISDLLFDRGYLLVAGPWGVRVLDARTLDQVGLLHGSAVSGARGLARCGSHVCLSRTGIRGLTVLDVSHPESPRVVGSSFTAGLGWDVAVWGSRAYVAHGVLGVGVYDISNPAAPAYLETLALGGVVRAVATRGSLLAVGKVGGQVLLYDLQEGSTLLGTVQADSPLTRLRFRGDRLWALRWPGARVTVLDVSDPGAPSRIGTFSQAARAEFHAWYLGAHRLAVHGARVGRFHLVEVEP